jgi:hypothetical protein
LRAECDGQTLRAEPANISRRISALWWIATSGRDGKTLRAQRANISAQDQRALVDSDLRALWESIPRTARQYLSAGSARYRAELIAIVLGDHDPPPSSSTRQMPAPMAAPPPRHIPLHFKSIAFIRLQSFS